MDGLTNIWPVTNSGQMFTCDLYNYGPWYTRLYYDKIKSFV